MINWEITSSAAGADVLPIQMSRAVADYTVNHIPSSVREWNVGSGGSRPHTAVYLLQEPVDFDQRVLMQFRMEFSANAEWPLQNLGRFRLSVSSDAGAFEGEARRFEAMKLTDPWSKLALAWCLDGNATAAESILEQHPQAATVLGDQYAASQDWKKAIDMYNRTITAETSDPELLLKRATAYERVEDWDAAAADMSRAAVGLLGNTNQHELAFETFKKAGRWREATTFGWMLIEKNPDDKYVWLRLAPVFVLAGDADGYQEYCRRYVEKFRGMTDAGTADVVCKACLLQPGGIAISELPIDALTRALDDGTADSGLLAWFWAGRGLAAYRSGDAGSAVEYARKSQQHNPTQLTLALSLVIEALGQQQLGEIDEARKNAGSADELITRLQRSDADKVHHDLLIPKILLAEAKAAIAGEIDLDTPTGIQAVQRTSDGKFLSQAIAEISKAITDQSAGFDAITQRARLYEQSRDWEAAAADWSRAAEIHPGGVRLLAEFAHRLKANGLHDQAETHLQKVRQAYEVILENDPADYLAADALTELLTESADDEIWTMLEPSDVTSQQGATLTLQDDGSILASGSNVSGDAYTIQAEGEGDIAAVRLEVLPDESLPNDGPGRHSSGNFQLAAFELFQVPASTPKRRVPVVLRAASASFAYSADNADVSGTIDNQVNKVWHVFGRTGESHWARFTLQEPITLRRGDRLIVVLKFRDAEGGINLGRFRLSTIREGSDAEKLALVSGPWARLAAACYLRGEQAAVEKLLEQHPSATAGIGDLMLAEQHWEQAIAMYNKSLAVEPTNFAILAQRAKAFEQLENWDAAAAEWMLVAKSDSSQQQNIFDKLRKEERWTDAASVGWMLVERTPENAMPWLRLAPVLIQAGDMVAYRTFCQRLAEQFDETTSADDAAKVLKALLLERAMADVPKAYEEAITRSLQDGTTAEGIRHFRWGLLGLLASLRGNAELAVENISKSEALKPNDISHALNLAVLAMVHHDLGHADQARQALDEATLLTDRMPDRGRDPVEPGVFLRPRHRDRLDTAVPTIHSRNPSHQHRLELHRVQKTPATFRGVVLQFPGTPVVRTDTIALSILQKNRDGLPAEIKLHLY